MDEINFKKRNITIDKEDNSIMIKGPIQQENVTIINVHVPNNKTDGTERRNTPSCTAIDE